MADNIASIVDWYGPYTPQAGKGAIAVAQAAAKSDYGAGLYAAIGHGQSVRRGPHKLLYVGMSDNLFARLTPQHHALGGLSIAGIWLGEVATAGIPGRRTKRVDPHLDMIEWMTAYFLRMPFNERKRVNPPPSSSIVLNRWWQKDYETPGVRPVARWADVMEWSHWRRSANLCWFGAKSRVVSFDERGKRLVGSG